MEEPVSHYCVCETAESVRVGVKDGARTQWYRRMGFYSSKNKTKQQKLPRRGKTGQLAWQAWQGRTGHDKAGQGTTGYIQRH